ncbi:MAG: excinuclease ABC subunit UvrA [Acidimicrobiia bacterium]
MTHGAPEPGTLRPPIAQAGWIVVRGAGQHNLKSIDVTIPRDGVTVITGVSGCGKSSLAFDTIYAEGHRQYLESLSPYARSSLSKLPKPVIESITGLTPTIAIEQRKLSRNPRSSVGTITEVSNYMRLLFARLGRHACAGCGDEVFPRIAAEHVDWLRSHGDQHPLVVAPLDSDEGSLTLEPGWASRTTSKVERLLTGALHAGRVMVVRDSTGVVRYVAPGWICATCGTESVATSSDYFTSNSPRGMCEACDGLGYTVAVDQRLLVLDDRESVRSGALAFFGDRRRSKKTWWPLRRMPRLLELAGANLDTPWREIPSSVRRLILTGTAGADLPPPVATDVTREPFTGLTSEIERLYRDANSAKRRDAYASLMATATCPACGGAGHARAALTVRLGGLNIAQVNSLTIDELQNWFTDVETELAGSFLHQIGAELLEEVRLRTEFMIDVGLDYLSLDRKAPSLSVGEGQRLRLTRQLGCGLVGITYILDEPSIGLHARDMGKLIGVLRRLHTAGNTVLVVEHDRETIEAADFILDLGPGAGVLGGRLVASGTRDQVAATADSPTGQFLRGTLSVESGRSGKRRPPDAWLTVEGANLHNLADITVPIPIGRLTCVTGVSGSGKTSLTSGSIGPAVSAAIRDGQVGPGPYRGITGWESMTRVATVTQQSIGRSARSTPATYIGIFDEVRKTFAKLPEARARRYSTAQFSFNTDRGGRCGRCLGTGSIWVQMHFLADVAVDCPTCEGRRFAPETLEIRYGGLNIADVLDLEVGQALDHFAEHTRIVGPLQVLADVGLGYLRLGQETSTLSGGEAQRLKLARELTQPGEGRTLYLIDEPTTGLHAFDIQLLVDVLERLVDRGDTVVAVEHDIDFIATADWIVDLGPGGGRAGGQLVASGPPAELANHPASALAPYLARRLAVAER